MDALAIAVLQAPYGLKGELKVRSLSGETGHIEALVGQAVGLRQSVAGRAAPAAPSRVVESCRTVEPHFLLKFKGVDSPEAARQFTGCEIVVDRSQASPCAAGEYYIGDLIGCAVVAAGRELGRVASVWENGTGDMLEVRLAEPAAGGPATAQVPFREPFVGAVDTAARTIELLTPWVLD